MAETSHKRLYILGQEIICSGFTERESAESSVGLDLLEGPENKLLQKCCLQLCHT